MNTPQTSSLQELFNEAIAFEQTALGLYGRFAKLFHRNSDVARFWINLRNDELLHVKLLHDTSGDMTSGQLSAPACKYMWDQVLDVYQTLSHALATPISNLEDAYSIAKEIESSEINIVFLQLMGDRVPIQDKRELLTSCMLYHMASLREFGAKYPAEIRRDIKV